MFLWKINTSKWFSTIFIFRHKFSNINYIKRERKNYCQATLNRTFSSVTLLSKLHRNKDLFSLILVYYVKVTKNITKIVF